MAGPACSNVSATGRPDTGVVTRFRMAGREYDQATKLYYMRARYYDPDLGRFISEDPIGIAGGASGLEDCMDQSRMAFERCGQRHSYSSTDRGLWRP